MAKEYIEREALLTRLQKVVVTGDVLGMGIQIGTDNAISCIEEAPAADVVEVVRCKDCKHATFYSCKNDACYKAILCEYQIGPEDENFFCSYGERRTENG